MGCYPTREFAGALDGRSSARRFISELLALHEEMIVQLRTDSAACGDRFKDAGTADFLTGLMERHEKIAWMLRAQLETKEEETR